MPATRATTASSTTGGSTWSTTTATSRRKTSGGGAGLGACSRLRRPGLSVGSPARVVGDEPGEGLVQPRLHGRTVAVTGAFGVSYACVDSGLLEVAGAAVRSTDA